MLCARICGPSGHASKVLILLQITYSQFLIKKLPSLVHIGQFTQNELSGFDSTYRNHQQRTASLDEVRTTLFDLANIYPADDSKAVMDFAQSLGSNIDIKLPQTKRARLKEIIRRFLATDDDSNGYLTGLGELAVLNELLEMPQVVVDSIEPELPNNRRADFMVSNRDGAHYIEVVAVAFEADRISNDAEVVEFFYRRAVQKLAYKKEGLPADFPLVLFTVLFGASDIESLLRYPVGLQELCVKMESIQAFWPFVVGSHSHPGSGWRWEIHPIKDLLS
jgi:hypothetical protein